MIIFTGIIILSIGYIFYLKHKNAVLRQKYIERCKRTGQPIDDRLNYPL